MTRCWTDSYPPRAHSDEEWVRRIGHAPLVSYYLDAMRKYRRLIKLLDGQVAQWPNESRNVNKPDENALQWFKDYFGNAMSLAHEPIFYPIAADRESKFLHNAFLRFDERWDEFKRLREAIDQQKQAGRLDDPSAARAGAYLTLLEECTQNMMAQIKLRIQHLPREKVYLHQ